MFVRLVLVFAGLVLGLACGEAALRASYATLPSLAAGKQAGFAVSVFEALERQQPREDGAGRCHHVQASGASPSLRLTRVGQGPELELWFAGDSVTEAFGVTPSQGFARRLADVVAAQLEVTVVLRNLAFSAAGYCGALNAVHQELTVSRPDLVVVVVTGDDLEDRAMVRVSDGVIAFPSTIEGRVLRFAARRSYLVNLAWFTRLRRVEKSPRRFVGHGGQHDFVEAQRQLDVAVERAGGRTLRVVLPAPGQAFCRPSKRATARCNWMASDLDLMANLLIDAGADVADLRGVWDGEEEPPCIPSEADAARQGTLAIHPHAEGHAAVANALAPALLAAVRR